MDKKRSVLRGARRWVLLALLVAVAPARGGAPQVLLLHSYHQGLGWSDAITDSITRSFEGREVELSVEYLDSKRRTLAEVDANMRAYLMAKYAATPPSVVIAADNNALAFLRTHRADLFSETTIVFCGINNYHPSLVSGLEGRVTGVVEETDPLGTLRLAQRLQPSLRRLVVVVGESTTGRALRVSLERALAGAAQALELEWWDGLTMDEVRERAGELGRTDAILLATFNRDVAGHVFSHKQSAAMIASSSGAPVYGLWDFQLGTGVLGGRVVSAVEQGRAAAKLAWEYVSAGTLGEIITATPNTALFNFPDLARHGLRLEDLPLHATVLNLPSATGDGGLLWFIAIALLLFAATLIYFFITSPFVRKNKGGRGLMAIVRNNTVVLLTATILGIILVQTGQDYLEYKRKTRAARIDLIEQKKALIKEQVDREVEGILNVLKNPPPPLFEHDVELLKNTMINRIKTITYDKGRGYLFIVDKGGKMVAHPVSPELEGQDISNIVDASGISPYERLLSAAARSGGGYASYAWTDPDTRAAVGKISFAREVPALDWIIATGMYLNDVTALIDTQRAALKHELVKREVSVLTVGGLALILYLVISRHISHHIAGEIASLQESALKKDPAALARNFTITEFKAIADGSVAAFDELMSARQKFIKAFRDNVDLMVISSLDGGELMEVNEAFLKTLGYREDEVIGKTSVELGLLNEQLRQAVLERMPVGGDTGSIECEFPGKNGEIHYGVIRAQHIDLGGEACLLSSIRDTTRTKQAEAQVQQLSRAVEQSPVSVVITNLEGTIEYVNPKFCEVSGYAREEAIGQNPRVLKSGETTDERYAELWTRIAQGGEWRGEFHNRRKDGTFYWEAATISGLRDAQGRVSHYIAVKEDITEKKALEGQLMHAQKLESVGQLAAGIAHEINTPIQFVGDNLRFLRDAVADLVRLAERYAGFVEHAAAGASAPESIEAQRAALADADVDYLREELPLAINQSLEGTDRVAKIVRAMKEFSHPGSTEMSHANLNEAIETTITVAKSEWKQHATIERAFDPDLPLVPCMISEINQVVLNLIVNARDAIEERGGMGTISFSTSHDETNAILCVTDTGGGMPEEIRRRIFDPFFTTKEVGRGTGQGLAIAHNVVVKKHGGEINVQSVVGEGTTFEIKLPLNTASRAPDGVA